MVIGIFLDFLSRFQGFEWRCNLAVLGPSFNVFQVYQCINVGSGSGLNTPVGIESTISGNFSVENPIVLSLVESVSVLSRSSSKPV